MANKKIEKNLVPMILKTFEVLEVFREKPVGLTYMEMVERYPHISKVSLYRILCSLEKLGYLRKEDKTNRYELGAKFIELGRITQKRQDIVRIAQPWLERLLEQFGENINFARLQDGELVFLARLDGTHALRLVEIPSRRQALYFSAVGKALVAFLPEDEREEAIAGLELAPITPNTITDRDEFRKELAEIRARGYSIDREESMVGVTCAGMPVLDRKGYPLAAVSISGPTSRSAHRIEDIAGFLRETTTEIARELLGTEDLN